MKKYGQNINQVVILAGGKGTRMREMTEDLPKPMVSIGGIPVIQHLINIFNFFGDFEFIICAGYKKEIIFDYFKGTKNVIVVDTGIDTNTGGRILKARNYLEDNFIVTYGDGLANVNINNLIDFHRAHKNIGTITVANPISRFGLLEFNNKKCVTNFVEKPKLDVNVNIGFMIFKNEFLNYLNENSTLEIEPLKLLTSDQELFAFEHSGYFEPMDTYREYLKLNKYWEEGNPPWMNLG